MVPCRTVPTTVGFLAEVDQVLSRQRRIRGDSRKAGPRRRSSSFNRWKEGNRCLAGSPFPTHQLLNMKRRLFLLSSSATAVSAVLAGCGGGGGAPAEASSAVESSGAPA